MKRTRKVSAALAGPAAALMAEALAEDQFVTENPIALGTLNRYQRTVSLHEAARNDDFGAIEEILQNSKAMINKRDKCGFAPIHYAAKSNCLQSLKLLVDKGADLSLTTEGDGLTPLHIAARYRPPFQQGDYTEEPDYPEGIQQGVKYERLTSNKEAVQYLIEKVDECAVNTTDKYGNTPLHMACRQGNVEAVSMLFNADCIIPDPTNHEKNTPLHEACLYGHSAIVKKLLVEMKKSNTKRGRERISKGELKNTVKQNPLHLACREGHHEIVQLLLDPKYVPAECSKQLLEAKNDEGFTPLHIACETGNKKIINLLLENGADVTDCDELSTGMTPIHIAASLGHAEVVRILLEKFKLQDKEISLLEDKFGQTLVHYAVIANDREIIKRLKEFLTENRELDLLKKANKASLTPLLMAAKLGKDAAFQELLESLPPDAHGALDGHGKNVVCLAAEGDHTPILRSLKRSKLCDQLLASADADLNTPLHLAAENGRLGAVKYLLTETGDSTKPNARNIAFRTPMHLAAMNGHTEVVKELRFVTVCTAEDENGDTPLHLACARGHYRVARVLSKEKKLDPNAKNHKGLTPLHCAAMGGYDRIVKILIDDFDAEVDPLDKTSATPLYLAAKGGHLHVVNWLLEHEAAVSMSTTDKKRPNALDFAIDNGHENVAMVIIKSKQWKEALTNTTESPVFGQTTPLRKLIRFMPKVAEEVLNRCTSPGTENSMDTKEFMLTFNYEFVEDFQGCIPPHENNLLRRVSNYLNKCISRFLSDEKGFRTDWGPDKFSKAKHPLTIMVEHNRTNLLTHPLVHSLLEYKLYRYGALTYLLNLVIYVIFIVSLTTFALNLPNPESATCQAVFNGTLANEMDIKNCSSIGTFQLPNLKCGICDISKAKEIVLSITSVIMVFYSICVLLFIVYLIAKFHGTYLTDLATSLNFLIGVATLSFSVVYFTPCFCPYNGQWQVGTVAVFLAWVNFCVFFRKLPFFGIYVLMFIKVVNTFLKVIILSFILIIAFSLAFYMAFRIPSSLASRSPFSTPARSVIKTMTMVVGEFDFEDLFHLSSLAPEEESDILEEIAYVQVANLLWILFLISAPILFLNLLTGLAVDDIKRIQEDAALKRLELQIKGLLSLEENVPSKIRSRFLIVGERITTPNKGVINRIVKKLSIKELEQSRYDRIASIIMARNREVNNGEETADQNQSQHDVVVNDMAVMKKNLQELKILVEQLNQKTGGSLPSLPFFGGHERRGVARQRSHSMYEHVEEGTVEDFFGQQYP